MKILVLNVGSSSCKSCVYDVVGNAPEHAPAPLWEAHLDGIGEKSSARLKVTDSHSHVINEILPPASPVEHLTRMLQAMWSGVTAVIEHPSEINLVGHRVVHGGHRMRSSVVIDDQVQAEIARLSTLAPIHNPASLRGIETAKQLFHLAPHVAVFDTAFHSHIPDVAALYAGPYEWAGQGIRRYGFHGISHGDCAHRAARILNRDFKSLKLVTCHLGNGCSLAAVKDGHSIDTTMGFTPMEGVMMGCRSGSIDPGLMLHLMKLGYTAQQLEQLLNHQSGLRGISGISGDMREIMAAISNGDERAQLAFDMYVYRVRLHIGAMCAALGGMDALIFTAGVGENSPQVRAGVCNGFQYLNLHLDKEKNENQPIDCDISTNESRVKILVMQAQENWAIVRESLGLLRS